MDLPIITLVIIILQIVDGNDSIQAIYLGPR